MDETPRSVRDDLIIVDHLMLLLMNDDGASVQGAGTLYYSLGSAVLTELALIGRIQADDPGVLNGPLVTATGEGPLLQWADDSVAEKTQRVQPLLEGLGNDLWRVDRSVDRGLLRREESRTLRVSRSTRWPAAHEEHESQLRAHVRRILEDGEEVEGGELCALLGTNGSGNTSTSEIIEGHRKAVRHDFINTSHWAVSRDARGRRDRHKIALTNAMTSKVTQCPALDVVLQGHEVHGLEDASEPETRGEIMPETLKGHIRQASVDTRTWTRIVANETPDRRRDETDGWRFTTGTVLNDAPAQGHLLATPMDHAGGRMTAPDSASLVSPGALLEPRRSHT